MDNKIGKKLNRKEFFDLAYSFKGKDDYKFYKYMSYYYKKLYEHSLKKDDSKKTKMYKECFEHYLDELIKYNSSKSQNVFKNVESNDTINVDNISNESKGNLERQIDELNSMREKADSTGKEVLSTISRMQEENDLELERLNEFNKDNSLNDKPVQKSLEEQKQELASKRQDLKVQGADLLATISDMQKENDLKLKGFDNSHKDDVIVDEPSKESHFKGDLIKKDVKTNSISLGSDEIDFVNSFLKKSYESYDSMSERDFNLERSKVWKSIKKYKGIDEEKYLNLLYNYYVVSYSYYKRNCPDKTYVIESLKNKYIEAANELRNLSNKSSDNNDSLVFDDNWSDVQALSDGNKRIYLLALKNYYMRARSFSSKKFPENLKLKSRLDGVINFIEKNIRQLEQGNDVSIGIFKKFDIDKASNIKSDSLNSESEKKDNGNNNSEFKLSDIVSDYLNEAQSDYLNGAQNAIDNFMIEAVKSVYGDEIFSKTK